MNAKCRNENVSRNKLDISTQRPMVIGQPLYAFSWVVVMKPRSDWLDVAAVFLSVEH